MDGHTVTIRPRRSKVSEPQIDAGSAPSDVRRSRPRGPPIAYASVIHVSLWMLLLGFPAR
jgi:hypothetical protein